MPVLFTENNEGLYTRLFSAGYIRVGDWWRDTDTLRGFWRLYRNEEDGVELQAGPLAFPLRAGQLCVVPPGWDFEIALRRPVDQLFAHFEFLGWPATAASEVIPRPVALPPEAQRDALALTLREQLRDARRLDAVLASRVKALLHLAIAAVLEALPEERARRALRISEGQRELLAVLQYIDEHVAEPMSNAQLAEIALSSESRFIRRFREATGRTPARYVQDRRIERASELLVSTEHSIDQVAELCGFANRYYFTRVFTQRMGLPPGRYRSERPHMPAA